MRTATPRATWRRRAGRAGQSMVIFAMIATVLFAVVGLAIDAGMSYLRSNGAERAAAAGALSGVPFLPDNFAGAQNAAYTEAARNGFSNGATLNGHPVTVTASQPAGTRNELTVSVTSWVPTTFLNIVGFGSHQVTSSATAVYLRPITLGQPGNQIGTDEASLGTGGSNYYFMRTEGWGNPRSEGDAYSPNPNQANNACGPQSSCASNPADIHLLNNTGSPGTDTADATLPARGGYNYLVWVPAGTDAALQVYNPAFAPGDAQSGYYYHEDDGSFPGSGWNILSNYSTMKYTIFKVNNLFNYNQDTKVGQTAFYPMDARNLNNSPAQYSYWGSGSTEQTKTCTPSIYHAWVDITNYTAANPTCDSVLVAQNNPVTGGKISGGASGQYYRVRIDNLNGDGTNPITSGTTGSFAHKGYAVRATLYGGGSTACSGCSVGALNDMCFYTPMAASGGGSFHIPFFEVPPEYRGQNITINIFDPGDVSGTSSIQILQPNNTGGTYSLANVVSIKNEGTSLDPANAQPALTVTPQTAGKADVVTNNGGNLFNGQWIQFVISIPQSYNPPAADAQNSGYYWQLQYTVNGTAGDTLTASVGFQGTPVHLLP